jgi:hypothetical protein
MIANFTEVSSTGSMEPLGTPATIKVTLDEFSKGVIKLSRTDVKSATPGLRATYTGAYKDRLITGTVTYDWPGHPEYPKTENWMASIEDQRAMLPPQFVDGGFPKSPLKSMLECENFPQCTLMGTWSFYGKVGAAIWPQNPPVMATLEIEEWTPAEIKIKRVDTHPGWGSEYTGKPVPGKVATFSGPLVHIRGNAKYPGAWYASFVQTSCERQDYIPDRFQAQSLGISDLQMGLLDDALDCLTLSANSGDPSSMYLLSKLYTPDNQFGTPPDQSKANYWIGKASAYPRIRQQRAQESEQFTMSALRMLGSAVFRSIVQTNVCVDRLQRPYQTLDADDVRRCIDKLEANEQKRQQSEQR